MWGAPTILESQREPSVLLFQLLVVVTTSAGGAISENCVGRLGGGGLHRGCVFRQNEPVGHTTVERSVPPAEIRLPVGVELMQFRGGKRTAIPGE